MQPLSESRIRTGIILLAIFLAVLFWRGVNLIGMVSAYEGQGVAEEEAPVEHDGWSDAILEEAGELPVLDGGRLKPFMTLARFTLLRTNGYAVFRKDKDKPDERIISATEWLLDVIFFPEVAAGYPCIRVADSDALVDVGLQDVTKGKKKSDRYSFRQLAPAYQTIQAKAKAYAKIKDTRRSTVQVQVLLLYENMHDMFELLSIRRFATLRLNVDPKGPLAKHFDEASTISISEFAAKKDVLFDALHDAMMGAKGPDDLSPEAKAVQGLVDQLRGEISLGEALRFIPPTGDYVKEETWFTPADVVSLPGTDTRMVEILADFVRMHDQRQDDAAFLAALRDMAKTSEKVAQSRDEWSTIPLEVTLYNWDPFFKALLCFLIGFILVALTWLWSGARWLRISAMSLTWIGLALLTFGITLRCLIRGNPPVTNLYETVIFITGCSVLAALITEIINKRRIALALAPIVGAIGLFVAGRYEVLEGKDTIGSLVAVLRSNFWLATHVTTIAIGYCAGLLAGGLGCFYVLAKAFGLKPKDPQFWPTLSRMIYGMIAFGLLFSLVGTILGGVWANDSWGRFWGWDPKENGALMIVIWNLMILHSRLAGFVKPFGIAVMAIVGGIIVGWSWWGVNLLNVGLHSYGFTQGVHDGLWIFVASQIAILMAAWDWHAFLRGGGGKPTA